MPQLKLPKLTRSPHQAFHATLKSETLRQSVGNLAIELRKVKNTVASVSCCRSRQLPDSAHGPLPSGTSPTATCFTEAPIEKSRHRCVHSVRQRVAHHCHFPYSEEWAPQGLSLRRRARRKHPKVCVPRVVHTGEAWRWEEQTQPHHPAGSHPQAWDDTQ